MPYTHPCAVSFSCFRTESSCLVSEEAQLVIPPRCPGSQAHISLFPRCPWPWETGSGAAAGGNLCAVLRVTDLCSAGLPLCPERILGPASPAHKESAHGQAPELQQHSEARVTPCEPGTGEGTQGITWYQLHGTVSKCWRSGGCGEMGRSV